MNGVVEWLRLDVSLHSLHSSMVGAGGMRRSLSSRLRMSNRSSRKLSSRGSSKKRWPVLRPLLFVLMTLITCSLCYLAWLDYVQVPTTTNFDTVPISTIPFPSITLCRVDIPPISSTVLIQRVFDLFDFECHQSIEECSQSDIHRHFQRLTNFLFDLRLLSNVQDLQTVVDAQHLRLVRQLVEQQRITSINEIRQMAKESFGGYTRHTFFQALANDFQVELDNSTVEDDSDTSSSSLSLVRELYSVLPLSPMPLGSVLKFFMSRRSSLSKWMSGKDVEGVERSLHTQFRRVTEALELGREEKNDFTFSLFYLPMLFKGETLVSLGRPVQWHLLPMANDELVAKSNRSACAPLMTSYLMKPNTTKPDFDECPSLPKILDLTNRSRVMAFMDQVVRETEVASKEESIVHLFKKDNQLNYPFKQVQGAKNGLVTNWKSFRPFCTYPSFDFSSDRQECTLFTPMSTMNGYCSVFNAKPLEQIIRPSIYLDAFKEAFKQSLPDSQTRNVTGVGAQRGLRVLLNRQVSFSGSSAVSRFRGNFDLSLNSVFNAFNVDMKKAKIEIGNVNTFFVTVKAEFVDEGFKELSIEERGCRLQSEYSDIMSIFNFYSREACLFECQLKMGRDMCNCTPWHFPFPDDDAHLDICDSMRNVCFEKMMCRAPSWGCDHCLPDCQKHVYSYVRKVEPIDTRIACAPKSTGYEYYERVRAQWEPPFISELLQSINESGSEELLRVDACAEYFREEVAEVQVIIVSDTIEAMTKRTKTLHELLAAMGGTIGLLLGVSVFAVIDAGFKVLRRLVKRQVVLRNEKKNMVRPMT